MLSSLERSFHGHFKLVKLHKPRVALNPEAPVHVEVYQRILHLEGVGYDWFSPVSSNGVEDFSRVVLFVGYDVADALFIAFKKARAG